MKAVKAAKDESWDVRDRAYLTSSGPRGAEPIRQLVGDVWKGGVHWGVFYARTATENDKPVLLLSLLAWVEREDGRVRQVALQFAVDDAASDPRLCLAATESDPFGAFRLTGQTAEGCGLVPRYQEVVRAILATDPTIKEFFAR